MNIFKKIAKNNSFLFFSQFLTAISSLLILIFIGRWLGDVSLGRYTFACALPQILRVFIDLGYGTFLIKETARNKSRASYYLNNIIGIRLFLFFVNMIFLVVIINILDYPAETKNIVYLFGFFEFLITFSNIFRVVFRAFEKMEYEAIVVVVSTFIRTSISIVLLYLGYQLIEIGYVFVATGLLEFLVGYIICSKKFVKPHFTLKLSFFLKTFKTVFPLGLLSIMGIIYIRIDTVLLSILKGDEVVGWYNAAYNLVLGFNPIPHLFMHSLLPMMSYFHVTSKAKLNKGYQKTFKYLLFLGLPISAGAFILAEEFIIFFYGFEFINSITALRVLSWDVFIKFLYICSSFVLVSSDKQGKMVVIVTLSASLNIILNLILIPNYSFIGAGVATLITEIFILISYSYLNYKNEMRLNLLKFLFQPIFACAVMAFLLLQLDFLNLFIKVLIGAVTYFSVLILIKGFNKEDFRIIKSIFGR